MFYSLLRAPEQFEKLEFTKTGKAAFISQVSKMSSHKMSRTHAQYLTEKMLDMMEDVDSAESQKVSPWFSYMAVNL